MSQHHPADDPRDAHLMAALRHAPDHNVVPPAQLTAAILGHARRAARRPGARAWQEGVRAVFERLWQPAPMAAFGTLAMATLIGVMWSAQEGPDAKPGLRPERVAAAAEPGSAPPPTLSRAMEAPAPRPMHAVPKLARQATQPAVPPAADTALPSRAARQDAMRGSENARDAAIAVQTPATVTAPAPATAAAPDIPLQREVLAKSQGDAAPASVRMRSEIAHPATGAIVPAGSSPLAAANLEIEAALAGDGARLRWHVSAQRLVAHEAAQRDWWQALAAVTQGRWQAVSGAFESVPITLLIDGAPRGSLSFEAQAVIWRDANGGTWRAALVPEALRALREPIARW